MIFAFISMFACKATAFYLTLILFVTKHLSRFFGSSLKKRIFYSKNVITLVFVNTSIFLIFIYCMILIVLFFSTLEHVLIDYITLCLLQDVSIHDVFMVQHIFLILFSLIIKLNTAIIFIIFIVIGRPYAKFLSPGDLKKTIALFFLKISELFSAIFIFENTGIFGQLKHSKIIL